MRRHSVLGLIAFLLLAPGRAHAQTRTITPGANLLAEGVPAIPTGIADEVRRYTEFRSAGFEDWHPQRREMLVSTRFGNTPQIHRVSLPAGARTQLTFFDEQVTTALYEPRQGRYFLFTKDVGGDEFRQIYRFDLAGGRITLLTDGGRSQNGEMVWSRGGDRIAYGSTRRNGRDRDIYVMDPLAPEGDRPVLQVEGGGWEVADWSPDDKQLLVRQFASLRESYLWLVDVATGAKTLLTPRPQAGEPVAYGDAVFSADGRSVYLATDKDSEFRRLAFLELSTRRVTPLVPDIPWDVESVELSPNGKTIAFLTNEEGISRLYLWDTAARRHRPVSGIPVGVISDLDWHANGRELALTLRTVQTPSDVYALDTVTGALTRWTESELGGMDAAELPDPALIQWISFDARQISGFYYRPPSRFTGKRPVLISIHGGPESQSRPTFLGRAVYFLNELGVAIIHPNVRGSTGFGKTFEKLDNATKREDSVRDIGALLDWIAQQPALDPSRVMVTGGSYGGYMTLAVATRYNDRICCSLDVVGISNFVTFLQNTESYRRDLRRAEYGDERLPEMREFFERIAPLHNADKITKPLFVVQGANDPRVPRSESEQMVATVKRRGTPVWYLVGLDEGHGFSKKGNQDFQFYATVMFVRQFLLAGMAQATLP